MLKPSVKINSLVHIVFFYQKINEFSMIKYRLIHLLNKLRTISLNIMQAQLWKT